MATFAESFARNFGLPSPPLSVRLSDKFSHISNSFSLGSLTQSLLNKPPPEAVSSGHLTPPAPEQSKGTLEVTVVDARHLNVVDPRKAHIYCQLYYEGSCVSIPDSPQVLMSDPFTMASKASNPTWNSTATFDVSTDQAQLTVFVFDRGNRLENEQDICLGTATLQPKLQHKKTIELRVRLHPRIQADSLLSTEKVTGDVRLQIHYTDTAVKMKLTPDAFRILRLLGRGSFGKVYQVVKRDTHQTYAMKVLSKRLLIKENEIAHTLSERNVLIRTFNNPFIVSLKFSFQTAEHLFLVMEYIPGGDLFEHLQVHTKVSEQEACFYISEIICAFEDIHARNVVYRDLKPENIMLDSLGHVALTDFGLCKELKDSTTTTFCGTGEYLAPEMIYPMPYGQAVDWWGLGILLYELLIGRPPFSSVHRQKLYERICRGHLTFPSLHKLSKEVRDLIGCLLERDPSKRLGSQGGASQVKQHAWFKDVQWDLVAAKRVQPPKGPSFSRPSTEPIGIPMAKSKDTDSMSFMSIKDQAPLSTSMQSAFKGFSYVNDTAFPHSMTTAKGRSMYFDDDY